MDADHDLALEARCRKSLSYALRFEASHSLDIVSMGRAYTAQRRQLLLTMLDAAISLGLPEEIPYDSLLLLDRAMSTPLVLPEGLLQVAAHASLLICSRQTPFHLLPSDFRPSDNDLSSVAGMSRSFSVDGSTRLSRQRRNAIWLWLNSQNCLLNCHNSVL
jgi:hypothetical protein